MEVSFLGMVVEDVDLPEVIWRGVVGLLVTLVRNRNPWGSISNGRGNKSISVVPGHHRWQIAGDPIPVPLFAWLRLGLRLG